MEKKILEKRIAIILYIVEFSYYIANKKFKLMFILNS